MHRDDGKIKALPLDDRDLDIVSGGKKDYLPYEDPQDPTPTTIDPGPQVPPDSVEQVD